MSWIQALASAIGACGLLIVLLGIPLILRRVPPGHPYGLRTEASFASDSDWYRVNAIGGRYFAISGLVFLGIGIIGFFLPDSSLSAYAITIIVAGLLVTTTLCVRLCTLKPIKSVNDEKRSA